MKDLDILDSEILECTKCSRLREVTIWPMSHICFCEKPEIFIVGRNPGLEHDHSTITKKHFKKQYHELWLKSKIGKYLLKYLDSSIIYTKMLFTNVCKCSTPNNSVLTQQEKLNCHYYLEQQYKIMPKYIITLGQDALEAFFPEKAIKYCFGQELKYQESILIPLYHPSYFAYKNDITILNTQISSLKKIKQIYER